MTLTVSNRVLFLFSGCQQQALRELDSAHRNVSSEFVKQVMK